MRVFSGEGDGAFDRRSRGVEQFDGHARKSLAERRLERSFEPPRRLPNPARERDLYCGSVVKARLDVSHDEGGEIVRLALGGGLGVGQAGVEIGGEGGKQASEEGLRSGCGVESRDDLARLGGAKVSEDSLLQRLAPRLRTLDVVSKRGATVAKSRALVPKEVASSARLDEASSCRVATAHERAGSRNDGHVGARRGGGVGSRVVGLHADRRRREDRLEKVRCAVALTFPDESREGAADRRRFRATFGRPTQAPLQDGRGDREQISRATLASEDRLAAFIDRERAAGGAAAVEADEDPHGSRERLPRGRGTTVGGLATPREDRNGEGIVPATLVGAATGRHERVLVSMKVYLGDAVMAAPTLDALDAAGLDVTLLTAPLVAKALGRDRFLSYQKSRWPWQIAAQARLLRAEGFGACVLVNRSVRAALIAKLARIPVRIGHAVEGRRSLLTHIVPYDESRFEAVSTAALVRPLGVTVVDPVPRLRLTPEEMREGDRLRQGAELAIQPGARYDLKRLPLDALRDAARAWQAEGRRLVMVGGPEERIETDALIAALDEPVIDLVGRCGVRDTMAVLAGASVAVGADTGVMHLAVAVGCPTVQAFGPTPVGKWGHDYGPHRIVAAPGGCMASLTARELLTAVGAR